MKRIFYLTPGCFDRGGISRYCRYQLKAISQNKDNNLIVYSLFGRNYNFSEDLPYKIFTSSRGKPSKLNKLSFSMKFLIDFLKQKPNTVFLCHLNFIKLAPILKLINPKSKIFLNIYGLEVWSSNKIISRFLVRFIDLIISDCENTKNYFALNISDKIFIKRIWDCADQEIFKPTKKKFINYKGKYIATLGRLTKTAKHKGYVNLLKAFKRFPKTKDLLLVIAGDGDLRKELEKLSGKLGIREKVLFTGYLSDQEISRLLTHAKVFSLVSKSGFMAGEGIPLTPIEAMSCGTPIVVGNADGSIECLQEDVGKAVDPDDIDEIFNALKYYVSLDDKEYKKISSMCVKNVNKNFSFNKFAIDLNQLIQE